MRVSLIGFFSALAIADAATSHAASRAPWGIPRGGAASSYSSKLDAIKEQVMASTLPSVRQNSMLWQISSDFKKEKLFCDCHPAGSVTLYSYPSRLFLLH